MECDSSRAIAGVPPALRRGRAQRTPNGRLKHVPRKALHNNYNAIVSSNVTVTSVSTRWDATWWVVSFDQRVGVIAGDWV